MIRNSYLKKSKEYSLRRVDSNIVVKSDGKVKILNVLWLIEDKMVFYYIFFSILNHFILNKLVVN